MVEYTYDSWGLPLSKTGSLADTLGTLNPFRYRGYIYDEETGFYYVSSRYYDPVVGRFLNSDGQITTVQGISGYNLFAYCGNNPIMRADPSGNSWLLLGLLVAGAALLFSGCSASEPPVVTTTTTTPVTQSTTQPTPPTPPTTTTVPNPATVPNEALEYAATVYAESGGQNTTSKQAVAHVINNRVGTYGWENITAVISAPYQFDGYNSPLYQAAMSYYNTGLCDNPIDRTAMDECLAIVIPIYTGEEADITGGALYFHSFSNPSDWTYHYDYTQVYVDGTEGFWFYR